MRYCVRQSGPPAVWVMVSGAGAGGGEGVVGMGMGMGKSVKDAKYAMLICVQCHVEYEYECECEWNWVQHECERERERFGWTANRDCWAVGMVSTWVARGCLGMARWRWSIDSLHVVLRGDIVFAIYDGSAPGEGDGDRWRGKSEDGG